MTLILFISIKKIYLRLQINRNNNLSITNESQGATLESKKQINQAMSKSTTLKCSSQQCSKTIKSQWYNFQHSSCKKILCFWCVLEIYKHILTVNPKFATQTKERLKFRIPCCGVLSEGYLPILQRFILNGCPFDGVKCKSDQKYRSSAGLKIGKSCLKLFITNYSKKQSQHNMLYKISKHGVLKCKDCHLEKVRIINAEQYEKILGICQDCALQRTIALSKKEIKSKFCYQCQQPQFLDQTQIKHNKNSQYIQKKICLVDFLEKSYCLFCIFEKCWLQYCQKFALGQMSFEGFIYFLKKIQVYFKSGCLTCGNQPTSNEQKIFQLNQQSIEAPYKLLMFLCGYCHQSFPNQKTTKKISQLKTYLHNTAQGYDKLIEPIYFKNYEETVQHRIQQYEDILNNQELLKKYEDCYRVKNKTFNNNRYILQAQEQQIKQIQIKKVPKQKIPQKSQSFGQLKNQEQLQDLNLKGQKQKKTSSKNIEPKDVKKRPVSSSNRIVKTSQTKQKIQIIQKTNQNFKIRQLTQNTQRKSIQDKNSNKGIELLKKSKHVNINKLFHRTGKPHEDAKKRTLVANKQQQLKGCKQQRGYSQSVTESQQSSARGLTESRESLRGDILDQQQKIQKQQKKCQKKSQVQHKASIYESDQGKNRQKNLSQDKQNTQETYKYQDLQYEQYNIKEKSKIAEDDDESMYSLLAQTQSKQLTNLVQQQKFSEKQIQKGKDSLKKQPITITGQDLSLVSQAMIRPHRQTKGKKKNPDQDLFQDIQLKEWKFNPSKIQLDRVPQIDFDKKLSDIGNLLQDCFPQILKAVKLQNPYQPITVKDFNNQKAKSPQNKHKTISLECKHCRKNQQEFVFLGSLCFTCFNLLLVNKLQIKQNTRNRND